MKLYLGLLLVIAAATGCTSMRSTMLNRMPDNSYVKNGVASKGVPLTVRVPTHLDIQVVETLYYYDEGNGSRMAITDGRQRPVYRMREVNFKGDRNLKLKSDIIRTPKVMTVDFVRPAAGIGEYNLQFDAGTATRDPEQYITRLETFLFDRTAEDVGNLISTIVPNVGPQTGDRLTNDPTATLFPSTATSAGGDVTLGSDGEVVIGKGVKNYLVKDRVVAYQRFDLNAGDFEEQVAAFVQTHLNGCHSCAGRQYPEYGALIEH